MSGASAGPSSFALDLGELLSVATRPSMHVGACEIAVHM